MDPISIVHWNRSRGLASARGRLAGQWVLGVSLTIVCHAVFAQAMYRIKPLGYLGGCTSSVPLASGFNNAGQVVGVACNAQGDQRAFLWKNDGSPMVEAGPVDVWESSATTLSESGFVAGRAADSAGSFAFVSLGNGTPIKRIEGLGGFISPSDINELGQLTGYAELPGDTAQHAFVWNNDGSPIRDLGTPGSDVSVGYAINESGQVVGSSGTRAFLWRNDGTPPYDLGTLGGDYSAGFFINAAGQVAGVSTASLTNPKARAFFWGNDGTAMKNLGTLGGAYSHPTAFNDSGQIAGWSHTTGRKYLHAFVWLNDGTPMKDLGSLGGLNSFGTDINSTGQVTGTAQAIIAGAAVSHAFLWRNDGTKIQDLNTLIDPADPLKKRVTLINGVFINDRGDIVAEGTDSRSGLEGLYLLQGTVLTLTPRSLAFGNQAINTVSAAKSVTVTNTSSKAVGITSIALKGSAPGQFAATNNCGNSLAGHATCTIKVTFKPTTKGAKSAILNVNGGGGGLRSVTLSGNGT